MNERNNAKHEGNFLVALVDEVIYFASRLALEDSQPMRRALCRSIFQFVDGLTTELKRVTYMYEGEATIGEENYFFVTGRRMVETNGVKRLLPDRPGFAKNLWQSFDIYGWTSGVTLDPRQEREAWERFVKSISIRNRVVHPADLQSLTISDDDLILMWDTFHWLKSYFEDAAEQVSRSILRQVNSMQIHARCIGI